MGRYLIIEYNEIPDKDGKHWKTLLPEETEEVFKGVFDAGYDLCSYHNTAGLSVKDFEEFKKTL